MPPFPTPPATASAIPASSTIRSPTPCGWPRCGRSATNGYNGSGAGTDPADTGQYVLTKSTDGGLTWSAPINITTPVKDDTNWRLIFQGPGHGLALRDGTLVFPSQYRDSTGTVRVCSVFSTDHGATWDFGSGVPDLIAADQ